MLLRNKGYFATKKQGGKFKIKKIKIIRMVIKGQYYAYQALLNIISKHDNEKFKLPSHRIDQIMR